MTTTSATAANPSSGATVSNGNELLVVNGGSATLTTVSAGGLLVVAAGGIETSGTIYGSATISGTASYDQIFGSVFVPPGGVVNNEIVESGGILSAMNNGVANNTVVEGGGKFIEQGSATITDITLEGSGAMLILPGGRFANAGSIVLSNGGNIIEYTYAFTPSGPNYLTSNSNAVISGFSQTDKIDFTGVVYNAATENLTYSTTGNVTTVTFTSGTTASGTPYVVDTFKFNTAAYNGEMYLAADANGGTLIESYVACYGRGTMIATDRGDVAVETLVIGDRIVTASGEVRPVKWIGKRSYDGRFIRGHKDVLPVCIKKNAIANGVPRRDLMVSPHHAMYLDGVLIEAKDLVNGSSIVQMEHVEHIDYYHVELDSHDVIIAEGAFSESYIDDDNRGMFRNASEYAELYPEAEISQARYCAPRVEEGFKLEAIRRSLALRVRTEHQKREIVTSAA